jgi:hypothetical protein
MVYFIRIISFDNPDNCLSHGLQHSGITETVS